MQQLSLEIKRYPNASFATFIAEKNQELKTQLIDSFSSDTANPFFLWGPTGVGKSHILQACCEWFSDRGEAATYLSLNQVLQYEPELLSSLDNYTCIAIDDIQAIAGHVQWQEALFHLFNRLKAANKHLLMAANQQPKLLNITLPDLASRFVWGFVYPVRELSDDGKLLSLQQHAKSLGLSLSDEVGLYLLKRYSRSLTDLIAALLQCDQASWETQRKLTIPFVKSVLAL